MSEGTFLTSLISGGLAGTAVDISLFPLDTIKTRLQSKQGFWASGGFKRIYAGLGPAAVGSALFFCTYDSVKRHATGSMGYKDTPQVHMAAASAGEVMACLIRVPVEIVKQRRQASAASSSLEIVRNTLKSEGVRGLYRGYLTTVAREIPFSLIQFPLWEFLKRKVADVKGSPTLPWEASLCGSFAGGFSAAVTTPLDVAKTRIMLAAAGSADAKLNTVSMLMVVAKEKGMSGLFAGVTPRVTWISIGGAVFFGVYEKAKSVLAI
jgi:solute carrier family 25 S-adenosylmethionine transporter 26